MIRAVSGDIGVVLAVGFVFLLGIELAKEEVAVEMNEGAFILRDDSGEVTAVINEGGDIL